MDLVHDASIRVSQLTDRIYTVCRVWDSGWDTPDTAQIDTENRGGAKTMAEDTAIARLAEIEAEYRQVAGELAAVGFVAQGSLQHRTTHCTNPRCRCNADPPRRHGPYWQWTTKKGGKTITRRLTAEQAAMWRQWIDNDRQLRAITTRMRQLSAEAITILEQHQTTPPQPTQV
jgi:hypothetical protein